MANAWIVPPLPLAAITASSTVVGAALNMATDYAGVVWQSGVEDPVQVLVDLGADVAFDTIVLFGIELAPSYATMQVNVSTSSAGTLFNPPTWTEIAGPLYAGAVMPATGKGVSLWSAPAAGFPVAARYILLRFQQLSALRLSRIVVGRRVQLERNFGFGAAFGVRDLGSLDFSRRGVLQRVRGKKLRTVSLTFSNIRKDEVEAQTKPLLERIGNTEMVALVTDPAPHAHRQNRCYFGPLVGDLGQTWRKADLFEAKTNVVSAF